MEAKPKTVVEQWYEKVVAAQRAVAKAEEALTAAVDPADQTRAFRELKARQRTLQQTLRSKS